MHPTRLALRLLALFTLSACGDPASTPAPSSGADAEAPPPDADATRDARDASASGTIASRHPHDVGIANDPEVVFAEAFEELTIGATQARFNSETYLLNGDLMALSPDVPKRSGGVRSLALRTTDQRGSTALFKLLDGEYDELFMRYYVKYPSHGPWHHTGIWMGGYQPRSPYASPGAGSLPDGDDRVSVAVEPVDRSTSNPRLDLYMYWMKMHPGGDGMYWGNVVINQTAFRSRDDEWMCVEEHVKLNTDPGSMDDAELDVWLDDSLVRHFDSKGPRGYTIAGLFCSETADTADCSNYRPKNGGVDEILDLRWRKSSKLRLNHIWPQNDSFGASTLYLDDVVVAKRRVGCIVEP